MRALAIGIGLLVGALFVVFVIAESLDPHANDPDAFAVRFINNLDRPVLLALCNSDHSAKCENPPYTDQIDPGKNVEENISPDVRTEWAIEALGGKPLRCVVLYWKYWPHHDVQLNISDAAQWADPCSRITPNRAL